LIDTTFLLEKPLVPIYITERYILVMHGNPPVNISVEMIIQTTCPVALVMFGDESHFDSKGTLKVMPLMFTLLLFNQKARSDVHFWRPIGYIPNLGCRAPTK
jgi:hypothetical protein